MKMTKKITSYVLVFLMVFSSFTILPSEFWGWANVSATDLTTEEPTEAETNKEKTIVEEPTTTETNNNEIAIEEPIAVDNNKDEITVAKSNAEATYTEGDFTYSIINDNEVKLVGYNGTSTSIVIPNVTTGSECSEIANKKVTAIGNNAFKEKALESVTFGKNIVTIGDYAFYKNKVLTKVDLSVCTSLTTIGKYAFCTNTALATLKLPNSLQKIDTNAFNGCNALTTLATGNNLTKIGDSAFANCAYLKTVNIKGGNNAVIGLGAFQKCVRMESLTIGDGIKTISKSAFKGCKVLENITFGKNITTIGDYAFSDNTAVMKIDMSVCTALTSIGNYAFSNAEWLMSLQLPKSLKTIGDYAFSCNTELLEVDMSVCTGLTSIGSNAFENNTALKTLKLPKSLKTIGDYAFSNNTLLKTVDMSVCTALTTIGASAFENNTALTTALILPDSLETIGEKAFYQCKKITSLETGSNLTSIGNNAFYKCEGLKTVNIKGGNNATIGVNAFYYCHAVVSLNIGDGVKTIGESAFVYCYALQTLTLGNDVTLIDKSAFKGCGLTELTIPNSVETIELDAFRGCSKLSTVTIGSGCTSINSTAFYDCNALKSIIVSVDNPEYTAVDEILFNKDKTTIIRFPKTYSGAYTIPNTVVAIEDYAFASCTELTGVTMGNSVQTIGNYAFDSCTKLTEVTIGDGVKTIGDYAFKGCSQFSKVKLGKNITSIGNYAFDEMSELTGIDFSICTQLETVGNYAFYNCDNLGDVIIRSPKLKKIGECAFRDCDGISTVDIAYGDNATIGSSAFRGCDCLQTVNIGDGVKIIYSQAFHNCKWLSEVNIRSYQLTNIYNHAFSECTSLYKVDIAYGNNATIGKAAFQSCHYLGILNIGNGIAIIAEYAFYNCGVLQKIYIGNSITTIGAKAFDDYNTNSVVQILGTELTNLATGSIPNNKYYNIYCYRYSTTHKTLKNKGYTNLKFFAEDICPNIIAVNGVSVENFTPENREYTVWLRDISNVNVVPVFEDANVKYSVRAENNIYTVRIFDENDIFNGSYKITVNQTEDICPKNITVNGVSVENFTSENREYTVWLEDISNVEVVPVFEDANVKYAVTSENNIYTISIFDNSNIFNGSYKITVKQKEPEVKYTVIGDVTLMLNNISATKVGGSIALPAGTYKLKIAKDQQQLGYNKIVADYCGGLTVSEKYSSSITLNATGGTYSFQFDTKTNKLVIKYDKNLPNEYLIGDIDTILKPVGDRPLSIGTQQLPAGTYKFKLSIGGKEYGYNKIVDDATTGSLSVNSKYSSQITLNATGGMYTFTLNTETNRLIIRHTPTANECTTDVHISGGFDLVLNDKSETGEDLTIATGTKYLEDGCYTFKVYNYGVAYTAGAILNDNGERTLSSKYTTPITLNATGGTYKFIFHKETGLFEVILLEE